MFIYVIMTNAASPACTNLIAMIRVIEFSLCDICFTVLAVVSVAVFIKTDYAVASLVYTHRSIRSRDCRTSLEQLFKSVICYWF